MAQSRKNLMLSMLALALFSALLLTGISTLAQPAEFLFDFESPREPGIPEGFFLSDGFFSPEADVATWDREVYDLTQEPSGRSLEFKALDSLTFKKYGYYPMTRFIPFQGSRIELSFTIKTDALFENDNINAVLLFYEEGSSSPIQTQEIGFTATEAFLPALATGVEASPSLEDLGNGWKKVKAGILIDREALPEIKRLTVAFVPNPDGSEPDPQGPLLIDYLKIVVS